MGRLLNIVTPFDQMAISANAHEAVRANRFSSARARQVDGAGIVCFSPFPPRAIPEFLP